MDAMQFLVSQIKISQHMTTGNKKSVKFHYGVSIKKRRCVLIGFHYRMKAKITKTTRVGMAGFLCLFKDGTAISLIGSEPINPSLPK